MSFSFILTKINIRNIIFCKVTPETSNILLAKRLRRSCKKECAIKLLGGSQTPGKGNIGENKMHRIANEYKESDHNFVLLNGSRMMIKRKKFEEFLCETTTI